MNNYHRIAKAILKTTELRNNAYVDGRYIRTIEQCANEATNVAELRSLVVVLIAGNWNGSLDWAMSHSPPTKVVRSLPHPVRSAN